MVKDPDRSIILCDGSGEVVARHDPRPEGAAEIIGESQALLFGFHSYPNSRIAT